MGMPELSQRPPYRKGKFAGRRWPTLETDKNSSPPELFTAISLIRTTVDPLGLVLGQEHRASQLNGADEDLGSFFRHENAAQYFGGGCSNGNHPVVAQKDETGDPPIVPAQVEDNLCPDFPGQRQTWFTVRHVDALGTATNDLVGKEPFAGKLRQPLNTGSS